MKKGTFTHTWTYGGGGGGGGGGAGAAVSNFLIPPRPVACRQPTTVEGGGHRPLELKT